MAVPEADRLGGSMRAAVVVIRRIADRQVGDAADRLHRGDNRQKQ